MLWGRGVIAEHRTQHSSTPDRGSVAEGLQSVGRALHLVAGLLDPWPGYAVPSDELLGMLTEERQGVARSRAGLDELLERHRRLLAEPMRNVLSGEWRS